MGVEQPVMMPQEYSYQMPVMGGKMTPAPGGADDENGAKKKGRAAGRLKMVRLYVMLR